MTQFHLPLSLALAALVAAGPALGQEAGPATAPEQSASPDPAPAAAPAEEGGVHAGLFATGVLDGIATGESIRFRHDRSVEPDDARLPEFDGTAEVSLAEAEGGGREARVALVADGRTRPVPPLPADAGHPLLLIFLESAVRTVAEATGGSPFYIRNRIRDTLWTGGPGEPVEITYAGNPVDAEELVYRPFAEDPNRARMGGFADLELRFLVSEAVPGGIARFDFEAPQAEGAPGVSETIALEGLEAEEES